MYGCYSANSSSYVTGLFRERRFFFLLFFNAYRLILGLWGENQITYKKKKLKVKQYQSFNFIYYFYSFILVSGWLLADPTTTIIHSDACCWLLFQNKNKGVVKRACLSMNITLIFICRVSPSQPYNTLQNCSRTRRRLKKRE